MQHISKCIWIMMMLSQEDEELDPLDVYMKGIDDEVNMNDEKEIADPHVHSTVAYEVMERDEVDYEAIVKGEQVDDSKNQQEVVFDQFV